MKTIFAIMLFLLSVTVFARNPVDAKLPDPVVNQNSWVMVEVWPDVNDFTLATYFLDFSYEKNRSLCSAVKTVFDRDQEAQSKRMKKIFSSYRVCLSVNDAVNQGYISSK